MNANINNEIENEHESPLMVDLRSLGMEVFITFFKDWTKPKDDILKLLASRNYTKKTYGTKISVAKKIFKEKKEYKALELILMTERIEYSLKQEAVRLLNKKVGHENKEIIDKNKGDKEKIKTLFLSASQEDLNKIENTKLIRSLRAKFRERIDSEFESFKDANGIIDEYIKTFDTSLKFPEPERAHIVPVYYLAKNERWDDIANPNNGLILDPNTHKLFDRGHLIFSKELSVLSGPTNNFGEFKINDILLSNPRKEFIKEWIKDRNLFSKKNIEE